MNTKENNKLLAEFLGWKTDKVEAIAPKSLEVIIPFETVKDSFTTSVFKHKDLKFHNDWNWLMLVVEKIFNCDMYHDMYIDYDSSMFTSGGIRLTTDINNVYGGCVEFVKWYKEQNNKQGNG